MPSVYVINSFRVLLSSLLNKQVNRNDEELDEMIHYLSKKDIPNIQLFGEELSENLLFLVDTMNEEKISGIEALLKFFDLQADKVLELLKEDIREYNPLYSIRNCTSMCFVAGIYQMPNFKIPFKPADIYDRAVRVDRVFCYCGGDGYSKTQEQRSNSSVSSEGEFYLEPSWS
jgi:hypothetical protein